MPHKVEISDKTYEDLKEFCSLNNLKIGQFADKLIRDGLMIEMYGDVPFTNYRMPKREEIVELVREAEANSVPISAYTGETSPAAQVVKDVIKGFAKAAEVFETMQKKAPQENIPPEIAQVVQDHWFEMIDDGEKIKPIDKETKDRIIEAMEKVEAEHPQTYITNQDGEKEIRKEMLRQIGTISASDIEDYVSESKKMQEAALEQAGVPAKVINKITKRRLK